VKVIRIALQVLSLNRFERMLLSQLSQLVTNAAYDYIERDYDNHMNSFV
jgi:hypothetical protein